MNQNEQMKKWRVTFREVGTNLYKVCNTGVGEYLLT